MNNENEVLAPTFEEVLSDLNRQLKRLHQAKAVETRGELLNNVYPMMVQMLEAINARLLETEATVSAILEESDTMIQPELGAQINQVLGLGMDLCQAVEDAQVDEVTKARLGAMVNNYRTQAVELAQVLEEVTLEEYDEDSEIEDAEEENEENE